MLNIQDVVNKQETQLREQIAKYSLLLVKLREEEEEGRRMKEKMRKKDEVLRRREGEWRGIEEGFLNRTDELETALLELENRIKEKEESIKDMK